MDKIIYLSPKIKILALKAGAMLCLSDGYQTEGYTLGGNSYGEDEWE